ncbi:hypothetical protein [Salinicola halophilus]|uniref:hypothetical protein n=1 Tax=Salinicola halophilus TaxID=184065 RepID=UPI000DA145DC|nr:hypothetical protein [Salinicola halophilus]
MIALSNRAKDDALQLDFQLAHEAAHILYPAWDGQSGSPSEATVLNEGLSTILSIMIVREGYGESSAMELLADLEEHNRSYRTAYALTIELLAEDHESIKKVRSVNPLVNDLSESDFAAAGVEVPPDRLAVLLQPFSSIEGFR